MEVSRGPDDVDRPDRPPAAASATAGGAGHAYSDELLIDMVRSRGNLFDKSRPDYKDEDVKAASWAAIASAFNMRIEDCQTRWVRLRERFGRELRLHKRGAPPGKEWYLYSRMKWLERFIQQRKRMRAFKTTNTAFHPSFAQARPPVAPFLKVDCDSVEDGISQDHGDDDPSTAGSLWTNTLKVWTGEESDQDDEKNSSSQEMAVDAAAHVSAEVSQSPSPNYHQNYGADGHTYPRSETFNARHPSEAFQESVKQSLSAMATSLEGLRSHFAEDKLSDDADELFARSLAASLRAIPRSQRTHAKMKLLAVMAEYENQD